MGIWHREGARTIENISRIRMVAARASGTLIASSLRKNTSFWSRRSIFWRQKVVFDRPTRAGSPLPIYGHGPKKVGIWPRESARTIENISRIRMDVARASGTDLASSLRQNTLLIEKIDFWRQKWFSSPLKEVEIIFKRGGNLASGVRYNDREHQ